VQKYIDDELVHGTISFGWGNAFVKEQNFILANLEKIKLPYLLLVAKKDILADAQAAEDAFPSVGSENKKLVVYPESYHEILNEVEEGELAMGEILGWVKKITQDVELCSQCGHNFNAHLLKGYGEPPTEGWMECPVDGCSCEMTWSAGNKLKAEVENLKQSNTN